MATAAAMALSPASAIYGALSVYVMSRARRADAGAPVICIGNATVGGTGKTPFALHVAQFATRLGARPFFLTRGYGGAIRAPTRVPADGGFDVFGDEALLLARAAPTIVSPDRAAGALLAVRSGATMIIMDDGHQNGGLRKDLSFLLVEASDPCGNGRLLPAGPLREPMRNAIARADALVSVGGPWPSSLDPAGKPQFIARRKVSAPAGRCIAFCGLGRPQQFFDSLAAAGCDVAESIAFPDHHAFSAADLSALRDRAKKIGAQLVTTEKDAVRIPAFQGGDIAIATLAFDIDRDDALAALIAPMAAPR
jgi:tetraacyldisaccharide 4'-kinase